MADRSAEGPMQRLLDNVRVSPLGPEFLPVGISWSLAFLNVNTRLDLLR